MGVVFSRLRRDAGESTLAMMAPFLRRHLAASPFVDVSLVADAMASFRSFQLWPQPVCGIAVDMLRCLAMETKSPGVTWRRALEKAFPQLQGLPATGFELSALVLAEPSSLLAATLDKATVRVPSEREVTAGAVVAIFQAMGVGEPEPGAGEPETSGAPPPPVEPQLQFLSLKKLRGIYLKIRTCLEQSLQICSAGDALAFVLARLDHLHRAMLKHVAREQARCKGVPGFLPCPPASMLLCGLPRRFGVARLSFDCALAGREPGSKWPRRNALKPLREMVADMV